MKTGDTFVTVGFDNHLWMIISDTLIDPDNVVIVNFTTNRQGEEQHCIVTPGEHVFVKHDTAVRFRDAQLLSLHKIHTLNGDGKIKKHVPLSPDLLIKIRTGARCSSFIPIKCRDALVFQGIIEE